MSKGMQASAPKAHAARWVKEPSGAMTQQNGCSAIGSRESMDTPIKTASISVPAALAVTLCKATGKAREA